MSGYTQTSLRDSIVWPDYENQTFRPGTCHIVRESTVLSEGDKTVSIYSRKLIKGTSKNGVVWHKWKTMKSTHLSVKTGNLESYTKEGNFFRNSTKGSFLYTSDTKVHAAINRLLVRHGMEPIEKFGTDCIFTRSYPLFEHLSYFGYHTKGIPHMHSKDMQEFTLKLFGKTRYRKDLVRAIASQKSPKALKNAHSMRGLVPIDWIIGYLKANKDSDPYRLNHLDSIRPAFKNMNLNQRKAVVTALTKDSLHEQYHIEDLLQFAAELPKETVQAVKMKPSTLYEAHNTLSMERTKLFTENKIIEPSKLAKKISGIDLKERSLRDLSIVPATSTHQVIDWGQQMNHCIGSYAQQAYNGTYTLTGIYESGKLIGNAMFGVSRASGDRRDFCVQIYGKNNQVLPDYVLKPIMKSLHWVSFRSASGVPYNLIGANEDNELVHRAVEDALLAPVPF